MANWEQQSLNDTVSEEWFEASSRLAKIAAFSSEIGNAFRESASLLKEFGPLAIAVLVNSGDVVLTVHVDGFSPRFAETLEHRFAEGHRLLTPITEELEGNIEDPLLLAMTTDNISRYCAWPLVSAGRCVGEVYVGHAFMVGSDLLPPSAFMETLASSLALIIDRNSTMGDTRGRISDYQWHEKLLESIIGSDRDAVLATDSLGRVLLLNPAGERLLGIVESEVIGKRMSDIDENLSSMGKPEDAFKVSRGRITVHPGEADRDKTIGTRISTFRHGGREYTVWSIRHEESPSRTSEQESRFSAFINNERLAVFYCDQDGIINSRNSTLLRLLGAGAGEIAEGTFIDKSRSLSESGIVAKVYECLASGEAVVSSHEYFHPTRGSLHLTAHFSPIVLADGNRIGVQAIIEDTTEYVKTQTSLMRSEERYRVFFRNAPIALIEVDFSGAVEKLMDAQIDVAWKPFTPHHTTHGGEEYISYPFLITAANPAAVSLYGAISTSSLIDAWGAGLNWISEEYLYEMVNAFIAGEPTYRFETVHRTLAGRNLYVSVNAAITPGHEADLSRVLLSIMDITRIKQMEATLKSQLVLERLVSTISARFLSLQPERTGEGIALVVKEAGKTLGVDNVTVFELNGNENILVPTHSWSREGYQSASKSINKFIQNRFHIFSKRLRKWDAVDIGDAAEAPLGTFEREFIETTGLGSLLMIPLIAQERVKGIILFASKNKPKEWVRESVALLRILSDMVANALDRQHREMLRRQSEDLLRTVFHSMAGGLIVADPAGRILLANPSAARGLRLERPTRMIGRKIGEVVRGAEEMLHNPAPGEQRQIVLTLNDGIKRTFGFSSAAAASGQRIIVFRDVTKMLEADTRQKRAEELARLGMVVTKLSHEIKNPIASILLGLRGLENSNSLDTEERYILTSVLEEVRFLKTFVGNFLDATRFQEANPRLMTVAPIFNSVYESQKRVAKRGEINLTLQRGAPDIVACVDENAMIRALGNLVKNAIEACEPNQGVVLGWRELDRMDVERRFPGYNGNVLCIFVEDTGPGIPKQVMENLFIPFTTTKSHGNGLGLSLVRETVAGHGGVIEVITPVHEDGGGTRFEILISQGDRPSCLDYHGGCSGNPEASCPMPEGCPVRETESYYTCWTVKGKTSLKDTGRWHDECGTCPVFLQGNLEQYYLNPSHRKEGA
jgi:PAS domain S-box-containing protein